MFIITLVYGGQRITLIKLDREKQGRNLPVLDRGRAN